MHIYILAIQKVWFLNSNLYIMNLIETKANSSSVSPREVVYVVSVANQPQTEADTSANDKAKSKTDWVGWRTWKSLHDKSKDQCFPDDWKAPSHSLHGPLPKTWRSPPSCDKLHDCLSFPLMSVASIRLMGKSWWPESRFCINSCVYF